MKDVKEIKVLNLGKLGVTANFLAEVKLVIKNHRKVKIKALRAALGDKSTKELAEELRGLTNSKLTVVRGHTFVLEKK